MFFDIFSKLCNEKGITPNKALVACEISRTSVAKWKKGATPNGTTLATLASYFDVSVDYLLGQITDADILSDAPLALLHEWQAAGLSETAQARRWVAMQKAAAEDVAKEKTLTFLSERGRLNDDEEEMLLLARHMEPLSEEERKLLQEQFRSAINVYLKAKGLLSTEGE